MSAPLLQTKMYIPPPRAELVHRARLFERLNEGLGRKLTLVSAPAGYGKTTVLAEWLATLRGRDGRERRNDSSPIAWLSLDEADNDPARFLAYIVATLQRSRTVDGQDILGALKSPQPIPAEAILTMLINEIAASVPMTGRRRPLLLVLDDYHVIVAQAVHDVLLFMLEHLPAQLMQLVIVTRADPPFPLARLRVRHQLTEIRQADLCFTTEETAAFLAQTMPLQLTEEQTRTLEARTEGWIAGLQLAALSMQDIEDVAAFIEDFGGSHRYVIDYLAEEAFRRQEKELREFLCRTAILDRLTASLCDAVTGRSDGKAFLSRMEQANLFLIPLDEKREWYRYHHLFADFLRKQTEPSQQQDWHRTAAGWYEAKGLIAEAVSHMLAAGDITEAGRLIGLAAEDTLRNGQFVTLHGWLEKIPDETVLGDYQLAIYKAWMILGMGHVEALQPYVRAAADLPVDAPQASRARLIGLRAYLARAEGRSQDSIDLAHQAMELTGDDDPFFRSVMLIHLAEMQHAAKDLAAAVETLHETYELGREQGIQFATLAAVAHLAYLLNVQGQLSEAARLCRRAIDEAVDRFGKALPSAGIAHIGLGMISYELNDLAQAEEHLGRGLSLSRQLMPMIGFTRLGNIWQAKVQHALGQEKAALTTIQTALKTEMEIKQFSFANVFRAVQAGLQLRQGDLAAAARWAEDGDIPLKAQPEYFMGMEYLVHARLLRAQDRLSDAQILLADYERAAVAEKRYGSLINIHILQSLVEAQLGNEDKAIAVMTRAVELAEPQSYRRVFLDEGHDVVQLLRRSRHVAPDFADELLAMFRSPTAGHRPMVASQELVEPLSDRELEVLTLVASGSSNREIAQALFVTVGTVKKHLNNVFGKLNVSSRTQAVARARELSLLP